MKEQVFVDASAWIAVWHPKDKHHKKAAKIYERLIVEQIPLIVTNWTAYEALSWVKERDGHAKMMRLRAVLENPRLVKWVPVYEVIEREALRIFYTYTDKLWGVVDCASLVVIANTGCRHAFGFDRHFVEAAGQYGLAILEH